MSRNTTKTYKSNVEMIAFLHCYSEGGRGMRGGAPSHDKVWGIAKVDNKLVNFWGRRNGVLKFKTHYLYERDSLEGKMGEKLNGRRDSVYRSVPVGEAGHLCPNLASDITHYFYSALAQGKVNTNH